MIDLFLNHKSKRFLRSFQRKKQWMNYGDMKRMVLFYDAIDYEKILRLAETLEQEGKKIEAWTYAANGLACNDYPANFFVITDKDLDFFYLPKTYIVRHLLGYPADLLLDLSTKPNALLRYSALLSPAKGKAGFRTEDVDKYDFILDNPNPLVSVEEKIESLFFYLRSLKVRCS